ncbi:DNA-protecting protein DprA [Calorimonas adulescens]|uniref:DNA-protecting protein DprA n=1 Tax=Calorimonas adulescens TaxID=2606906 RepID=A0A5D8QGL1_9THEO|nr:DNA-protecting protein DprA [Calorimonas adulescens]
MDKSWIKLSLVPQVGPQRFFDLIEYFGSAEEVFKTDRHELKNIGSLNDNLIEEIQKCRDIDIDVYINKVTSMGIKLITYNDNEYPNNLKNIHYPPPVLYLKGNVELLDGMNIAIVGSRNCSYYGSQIAYNFAARLAAAGFTIVSGMARGIDSMAHQGAISANGKTIAVVGSGLDIIYPRENKELYRTIAKSGALVSEFPLGTEPLKQNFPRRNRIISGLSVGVLVVEAGVRSGSLITAGFALEQGKDVFAIPGNINYESSMGTNNLIKEGAKLVTSVNDIIEEYELRIDLKEKIENQRVNNLSEGYKKILDYIDDKPISINSISNISGVSINELIAVLNKLVLLGYIKELPGKFYVKV